MKFSLDQNVLTIELSGWERFISATMSSQIKVPLDQIASIDTDGSKIQKVVPRLSSGNTNSRLLCCRSLSPHENAARLSLFPLVTVDGR